MNSLACQLRDLLKQSFSSVISRLTLESASSQIALRVNAKSG